MDMNRPPWELMQPELEWDGYDTTRNGPFRKAVTNNERTVNFRLIKTWMRDNYGEIIVDDDEMQLLVELAIMRHRRGLDAIGFLPEYFTGERQHPLELLLTEVAVLRHDRGLNPLEPLS